MRKSLRERVGENIKRVRKSKNLTQQKFADKLNVSVRYVAALEAGSENLSLETLERISKSLAVDPSDFLVDLNHQGSPHRNVALQMAIDLLTEMKR